SASAGGHLQAGVDHAGEEAVFERLMEVAHFPKFFLDPAIFDEFLESLQLSGRDVICLEGFESGLGGKHAGFECEVDSLQAHRVEEPCRVSNDHASIEVVLGQRPVATLWNRLRAIRVKRASFKDASDVRMRFELLKALVWIESRV